MLAHIFYVFLVLSIGASIGFVYGCMFRVAGPACILLALLAFAPTMAKAECLDSASAVRQAHNGAHATWHNVDGHRCYMAGYGRRHEAKVIPLPKERPAKFARATARPDEPAIVPVVDRLAEGRRIAERMLSVCWGPDTAPVEEGRKRLALAMNDWIEKRKAKLAEVGR